MRKLLLLAFSFVLLAGGCRKNKPKNPVDELPPETQTGAMTFGCKVNGKVFVPRDGRGKPGLFAQYVNLGSGAGGGWHLNLLAADEVPSNSVGVHIVTDSLLVQEGNSYTFKNQKGFAKVRYYVGLNSYIVSAADSGQLTITKHNLSQRLLAGRFWFTATNANGEKVNVTDGRFDIVY